VCVYCNFQRLYGPSPSLHMKEIFLSNFKKWRSFLPERKKEWQEQLARPPDDILCQGSAWFVESKVNNKANSQL
jgi:hypothetical protein